MIRQKAETSYSRDLRRALRRGWSRRCPCCGTGPMMQGYLKVRDICPVCRQPLQRDGSDDAPAWLGLLLILHLSVTVTYACWMIWDPPPEILFTAFAIASVALSLYLFPRMKGLLIAARWARHRRH